MDEEKYLNDFNIISVAGMSKSYSQLALKAAREGNFEEAEKNLEEAEKLMNDAHNLQFQMLQQESQGNPVDVTIVTVHAQDHITMAMVMHDMAEEILMLYRKMG